ncbi:acyl carrier protein [Defluviimonas sp. WL0002]|uniref:Acyl carrier protein n=1 Tax=Albidovulum marisflavi TaxID=2984159 RepID=A0ABT2ZFP7_9RHOB|nr:acyl carrier protein [Defluviimonas sp. WL0002]MCV2869914.1 acyl carrier protein [Defluviimonas sp. WL0002]
MPDTEIQLRFLTARILDIDAESITPATRFVEDLGVGSLETVELMMAFEHELDMEIPDDVVETLRTFGAAVNYVRANRYLAGSVA